MWHLVTYYAESYQIHFFIMDFSKIVFVVLTYLKPLIYFFSNVKRSKPGIDSAQKTGFYCTWGNWLRKTIFQFSRFQNGFLSSISLEEIITSLMKKKNSLIGNARAIDANSLKQKLPKNIPKIKILCKRKRSWASALSCDSKETNDVKFFYCEIVELLQLYRM